MKFTEAIFGHHGVWIWIGTLFWTLSILIVFKLYKAPKIGKGFKIGFFINDNLFDMILNLFLAGVMLRAGDPLIHLIYKIVNNRVLKPVFDLELSADGMDVVILVALIVLPLSYLIHKFFRKPANDKIANKMHIHNKTCNHK